jgi:hypothetical protein
MRDCEDRIADPESIPPIRLLTLTWNVGNGEPSLREITSWLPAGGANLDLIVVATQENSYFAEDQLKAGRRRGQYATGMLVEKRLPAARCSFAAPLSSTLYLTALGCAALHATAFCRRASAWGRAIYAPDFAAA